MIVSLKPLSADDWADQNRRPAHYHGLPGAQDFQSGSPDCYRPFDQIIPEILAGNFDAGLIIHEGQLTYSSNASTSARSGRLWRETTGLVLPLGATDSPLSRSRHAPHRNQGCARQHPARAGQPRRTLDYAMQFARDLDARLANRFVSMYVTTVPSTTSRRAPGHPKTPRAWHERGIIPMPEGRIHRLSERVFFRTTLIANWLRVPILDAFLCQGWAATNLRPACVNGAPCSQNSLFKSIFGPPFVTFGIRFARESH